MKHSTRKMGVFAAFAAVLMGTSCIFDTRDANPPPAGGGGGGCVLDAPNKAFACMAAALAALKDADYIRSISDRYIFTPTTADLNDEFFNGKCPYTNFDKQAEQDHVAYLVSNSDTLIWDFGSPVIKINENTYVQFEVTYSLREVTNATPPVTTVYRGVALIDVRNEAGNWRVTAWNETQTLPPSRTWGYLRGVVRLQLNDADCPP